MIEVIKQQFKPGMSTERKLNLTREFLQVLCLKFLSEKDFYRQMAFVGGTALRIFFDLKRFSEDLDFSLIRRQKYNLKKMTRHLERSFHLYNLPLEPLKPHAAGNVHSFMMKFPGLLKELGLSALEGQKLSIKLEIDTNPPTGWKLSETVVNKIYMFRIVHHDLPSLFATKLHACFYRKFTKGRDFYDLLWYLGKKVTPNFVLLNNAIRQTEGKSPGLSEKNFKDFLLNAVEGVDFGYVKKDMERFLENKEELGLFNQQVFRGTIETTYGYLQRAAGEREN